MGAGKAAKSRNPLDRDRATGQHRDNETGRNAMQVFDGHNDVLSRLWRSQDDPVALFRSGEGHLNAAACRAGGFAGGFFAIFCPPSRAMSGGIFKEDGRLSEPLPDPLDPGWAARTVLGQLGIAQILADSGHLELVTDAPSLARAFDSDRVACLLHLEGAEAIDEDLLALDALHGMGLRSLGPVWTRPNVFGHGVPFAHKRDGDTGDGLTEAGRRLVSRCRDLGILLDTSHITVKGFHDIAELGLPVVATHSNAWALCRSSRNLTDDQLRAIRESGGVAGLNFEPAFLSEQGWATGHATLEDCLRQLDHLIGHLGEDKVALGSDFDGARTPEGIGSAADLPVLVEAMRGAEYGDDLIARICHRNWLDFLARHFGAA